MSPRIVAAAIRTDDGVVHSVPAPGRHHHVIAQIGLAKSEGGVLVAQQLVSGDRQGFITDSGEFVGRKAALEIARAAGQIKRETAPQHGLFSEDLW
jgi:hypothetical protein